MNTVKKLELKFKCENLSYYLSSSQIILFVKDPRTQEWELTPYKTEVITNSVNPEFVEGVVIDYSHEELQQIR